MAVVFKLLIVTPVCCPSRDASLLHPEGCILGRIGGIPHREMVSRKRSGDVSVEVAGGDVDEYNRV